MDFTNNPENFIDAARRASLPVIGTVPVGSNYWQPMITTAQLQQLMPIPSPCFTNMNGWENIFSGPPFQPIIGLSLPFVSTGVCSPPLQAISEIKSEHDAADISAPVTPIASAPAKSLKKRKLETSDASSEKPKPAASKASKKTRYQCEECSKFFTRPSSLATHRFTHTGEKPHECTFLGCSKRFSVVSNLRRHMRLHQDPQPRGRRKNHTYRHYNAGEPYSVSYPVPPTTNYPSFLPPNFSGLELPADADSDQSDCTSKRGFQELTGDNSDDTECEADRPSKKSRYQCDQCLKYFTRPSSLTTHMYTHTGEKPHECTFPGCNKRFSVLSNLRRHTRLHLYPQPRNIRRKQQDCRHYFLDGPYPMFPMPPLDLPHLLAMQIHEQMLANGDFISGASHIHPSFIPGIPLPPPHAKLPGLQPIDIVSAASLMSMPMAPLQTPITANSSLVAGGLSELGLGFGQDEPTTVPRRFSAPPMPAPMPNSWLARNMNSGIGGHPSANNCNLFL
ncbi:hypothetical protein GGH19_000026 [Coemansia sp. RSA 1807]|nr:hypothetical protein IW142_000339 [Coemansia sp. RSA 564]KAJ2292606.1 hypothetical protein IW141_001810 [Coemansia sp. RSA 355]KAJ2578924.1 hypothetical protein GGH19_000026 [Coemansia sp. RSA 1807]